MHKPAVEVPGQRVRSNAQPRTTTSDDADQKTRSASSTSVRRHRPVRRSLPTPAELDSLTGDRDRVIDLIRICSLIVVVAGHSIMLTVSSEDGAIRLGNLLGDLPLLQPATWLLQVMPLFFFAGAAAATYGLLSNPAATPGHWLFGRARRLMRPTLFYVLAVAAVSLVADLLGFGAFADVVARIGVQLLWFLGAYLLVLAVVPMLHRIDTGRRALLTVGGCWAATAVIDVTRLTFDVEALGYLNFLTVWAIPAIFGIAYAKHLLRPATAVAIVIAALVTDIALVGFGPYEVSLVTVPGQQLSNMSPPSLLLAGHAIALCAAAIALRGVLARIAAHPRIWWWVALGNRGAMTLYLWHLPVLAAVLAAGHVIGFDRAGVTGPMFAAVVATETLLVLTLMIPAVAILSPLENRALPWWDARVATRASVGRDTVVLAVLILLGVAILMVARFGLVGDGLMWAALALGAATSARTVARRPDGAPVHG